MPDFIVPKRDDLLQKAEVTLGQARLSSALRHTELTDHLLRLTGFYNFDSIFSRHFSEKSLDLRG